MADLPPVPLTLEGSSLLHQFFRFDWKAWRSTPSGDRERIAAQAVETLRRLERAGPDAPIRSALFSELGHKGDLILIHFRDSFEALNQVELELAQTELYDFLEPRHSYVSVVELGLYESSRKTYEAASAKGLRRTRPSGRPRSPPRSSANPPPWRRGSSPPFPRPSTSASIPWIASAASRRTGTPCPSPSASA